MQEKSKKRKIQIILSIILLFIGILGMEGIYFYKNRQKNRYQIKNNTSYEVTLKPNQYFSSPKIEKDRSYIANSIESIDLSFDYSFQKETKDAINYAYDVTATLKSYAENGTKLIWTKEFPLKESGDRTQKDIHIKETYHLDYSYYDRYVKSFEEYYHIKTETYLYVKLTMDIKDQQTPSILFTIPMSEDVIEITMMEENENDDGQNIDLNQVLAFDFIVLIIVLIVSKFFFCKKNEEAMLKEYRDIIIELQKEPKENSDHRIYLNHLKDLITIAVNHNEMIFHYQDQYYLRIDNTYYIYILKNEKKA